MPHGAAKETKKEGDIELDIKSIVFLCLAHKELIVLYMGI